MENPDLKQVGQYFFYQKQMMHQNSFGQWFRMTDNAYLMLRVNKKQEIHTQYIQYLQSLPNDIEDSNASLLKVIKLFDSKGFNYIIMESYSYNLLEMFNILCEKKEYYKTIELIYNVVNEYINTFNDQNVFDSHNCLNYENILLIDSKNQDNYKIVFRECYQNKELILGYLKSHNSNVEIHNSNNSNKLYQFHIAPEINQNNEQEEYKGSQEADIYSFGQFLKSLSYDNYLLSKKDIQILIEQMCIYNPLSRILWNQLKENLKDILADLKYVEKNQYQNQENNIQNQHYKIQISNEQSIDQNGISPLDLQNQKLNYQQQSNHLENNCQSKQIMSDDCLDQNQSCNQNYQQQQFQQQEQNILKPQEQFQLSQQQPQQYQFQFQQPNTYQNNLLQIQNIQQQSLKKQSKSQQQEFQQEQTSIPQHKQQQFELQKTNQIYSKSYSPVKPQAQYQVAQQSQNQLPMLQQLKFQQQQFQTQNNQYLQPIQQQQQQPTEQKFIDKQQQHFQQQQLQQNLQQQPQQFQYQMNSQQFQISPRYQKKETQKQNSEQNDQQQNNLDEDQGNYQNDKVIQNMNQQQNLNQQINSLSDQNVQKQNLSIQIQQSQNNNQQYQNYLQISSSQNQQFNNIPNQNYHQINQFQQQQQHFQQQLSPQFENQLNQNKQNIQQINQQQIQNQNYYNQNQQTFQQNNEQNFQHNIQKNQNIQNQNQQQYYQNNQKMLNQSYSSQFSNQNQFEQQSQNQNNNGNLYPQNQQSFQNQSFQNSQNGNIYKQPLINQSNTVQQYNSNQIENNTQNGNNIQNGNYSQNNQQNGNNTQNGQFNWNDIQNKDIFINERIQQIIQSAEKLNISNKGDILIKIEQAIQYKNLALSLKEFFFFSFTNKIFKSYEFSHSQLFSFLISLLYYSYVMMKKSVDIVKAYEKQDKQHIVNDLKSSLSEIENKIKEYVPVLSNNQSQKIQVVTISERLAKENIDNSFNSIQLEFKSLFVKQKYKHDKYLIGLSFRLENLKDLNKMIWNTETNTTFNFCYYYHQLEKLNQN